MRRKKKKANESVDLQVLVSCPRNTSYFGDRTLGVVHANAAGIVGVKNMSCLDSESRQGIGSFNFWRH
jgi:hypothetical protein